MGGLEGPHKANPLSHWLPWILVGMAMIFGLCGLGSRLAVYWKHANEAKRDAESKSRIDALLADQADSWNRGDLDGFMAGYWDSPDLEFVSGTTTTKGYQPVKDRYFKRYKAEGKEMGTLTFSDIRVTVLGEGGAKATGKWKVAMSKESPSGGFALQLRMFDNGWKIVQDTTSSDEPPKKE